MSTTTGKSARTTHSFTFVFAGDFDELKDDWLNALFEAGCDDAHVTLRDGVLRVQFDREAPSFARALTSALGDVERSGLGLEIIRVEPVDEG